MSMPQNSSGNHHAGPRKMSKPKRSSVSAGVLAIVLASAAVSADATIPWSSLSSGAATLSGSKVSLRGSFGHLNSPVTNGNSATVTSGFWTGVTTGTSGCNAADVTGDGLLDLSDVNLFINAFLTGGSQADLNNDGVFDLFDINQFVSAFLMGCV